MWHRGPNVFGSYLCKINMGTKLEQFLRERYMWITRQPTGIVRRPLQ
jgi:hypothetical protein